MTPTPDSNARTRPNGLGLIAVVAVVGLLGLAALALGGKLSPAAQPSQTGPAGASSEGTGSSPMRSPEGGGATGSPSGSHSSGSPARGIAGLSVDALAALLGKYGVDCESSADGWDCAGEAPDGSDYSATFQGSDPTHLTHLEADLTQTHAFDPASAVDFLGNLASLAAGTDGAKAQAWVRDGLAGAARGNIVGADFGSAHFTLQVFGDSSSADASLEVCAPGTC